MFRTLLVITMVTLGGLSVSQAQTRAYSASLARFDNEPSVRELQLAALKYFKLDEATINSLATNASLKGLIPTLGLEGGITTTGGGDETFNDEYDPVEDQNAWLANRAFGNSFSISGNLSWNLPALAFSGEALAVMSRAGNRGALLKTVTTTYFQRRKAQIDLATNPPEDDESRMMKELAVAEHTAMLDAMTGGWFSKQLGR
jgi:hypothetical protein